MVIDAERDFVAIGQLASRIGKPVRDIERAATELNLHPAMRVNFVPFFDGRQVERLTKALNKGSK